MLNFMGLKILLEDIMRRLGNRLLVLVFVSFILSAVVNVQVVRADDNEEKEYRYLTVVDHFMDFELNEVAHIVRSEVRVVRGEDIDNYTELYQTGQLAGAFAPDNGGVGWTASGYNNLQNGRYDEYNSLGLPVDASEIYKSYTLYKYTINGKFTDDVTAANKGEDGASIFQEDYYPIYNYGFFPTDHVIYEDTVLDYYYWLIPETKLTVTSHYGVMDADGNFTEESSSKQEVASIRNMWAAKLPDVDVDYKNAYDLVKATFSSKSTSKLKDSLFGKYISDEDAAALAALDEDTYGIGNMEQSSENYDASTVEGYTLYRNLTGYQNKINKLNLSVKSKYYLFETANVDLYYTKSSARYINIKVIDEYIDADGSFISSDVRESKDVVVSDDKPYGYSYDSLYEYDYHTYYAEQQSISGSALSDTVVKFTYRKFKKESFDFIVKYRVIYDDDEESPAEGISFNDTVTGSDGYADFETRNNITVNSLKADGSIQYSDTYYSYQDNNKITVTVNNSSYSYNIAINPEVGTYEAYHNGEMIAALRNGTAVQYTTYYSSMNIKDTDDPFTKVCEIKIHKKKVYEEDKSANVVVRYYLTSSNFSSYVTSENVTVPMHIKYDETGEILNTPLTFKLEDYDISDGVLAVANNAKVGVNNLLLKNVYFGYPGTTVNGNVNDDGTYATADRVLFNHTYTAEVDLATKLLDSSVILSSKDTYYQSGSGSILGLFSTSNPEWSIYICLEVNEDTDSYIGDVNIELQKFSYNNDTNYLSGQIVVVEWVDTDGDGIKESTVPKYAPKMQFVSTDGTETIDVFVTATGTNTYYFDRLLSGLTEGKEYVFKVTSGNPDNVSQYKTVPIYTGTSAIGSEGVLGKVGNQKLCYSTADDGTLLLSGKQPEPYNGNVNSLLTQVNYGKSEYGDFITGNIVITEWIDGVSTVPETTPKMTFESYDGTEVNEVFMACLDGTNTYYFDRSLNGNVDTTKEYIFRITLTEPNNVSEYKSMVATTNEMSAKEGVLWETDTQVIKYKTVWADMDNQLRVYAVDK